MKVLMVGGGRESYYLARRFAAKGFEVVIVDRRADVCTRLARRLSATVVLGDGGDPRTLEDAGARGADVVLAITPFDQDNLIICQLATLRFGVPRAVALANDPDNAEVFEQLGVTSVSITDIVGGLIEQQTIVDEITRTLAVAEGRVNVTEVVLDEDAPVLGRCLDQLDLPRGALVAVVVRASETIVPGGSDTLRAGDRLVLVTLPEDHGPALRALTGESA